MTNKYILIVLSNSQSFQYARFTLSHINIIYNLFNNYHDIFITNFSYFKIFFFYELIYKQVLL